LPVIIRGMFRLAIGHKSGIKEFDNSLDGFTASLAPLIAFPLVGAAVSIMAGQWQLAVVGFLSRLCAVLALPVITHEFARRTGREKFWLRTATALDWSFWMIIPVLLIAAFIAASMVSAGLDFDQGRDAALGIILAYMLWYHWFIARTGLELSRLRAVLFVAVNALAIGLFSAGPYIIDYLFYGKIVNY